MTLDGNPTSYVLTFIIHDNIACFLFPSKHIQTNLHAILVLLASLFESWDNIYLKGWKTQNKHNDLISFIFLIFFWDIHILHRVESEYPSLIYFILHSVVGSLFRESGDTHTDNA
ncbi:hypothetical protein ACJX0J_011841 [Zea mays]